MDYKIGGLKTVIKNYTEVIFLKDLKATSSNSFCIFMVAKLKSDKHVT